MNGASHGRRPFLRWHGGRRPRAGLAGLGVCLIAGCLAFLLAAVGGATPSPRSSASAHRRHRHTHLAPVQAVVSVTADAARTAVPASYLGLSTEYWALPLWSGEMPLLERALSLVRVRGAGPLILRVGGDSADHAFWDPNAGAGGIRPPPWAFSLAPRWLGQARALVRMLGVRLILDLNLITDTPSAAAQWARAAKAGLPPRSIDAFEVGNEPDIYSRADWRAITAERDLNTRTAGGAAGHRFSGTSLPAALTAGDYVRDFHSYARALDALAPGAMMAGPALANPVQHGRWVQTLIDGARRDLGMVTVHRYPYTGCPGRRGTRSYATIGRVLGPAASTGLGVALRPLVDDAHDAGLPLRLTELNSVNCGGRAGVSDAFATALWAPDALFSLLRAGVDGVNLHVRAAAINAPFALGPGGLQARPLLYGLILFAHTLGPGRPVGDAPLASEPVREPRGMGGAGGTRHPARPAHQQEPPRRAGVAAPAGERCGRRAAPARSVGGGAFGGHLRRPRARRRRPLAGPARAPDGDTACRRLRGQRAQHERGADRRPGAARALARSATQ